MNIEILNEAVNSYMRANPWLILIIIWAGIWKLIALWKAAKHNHLTMFIVLGALNTVGIAEIIYIIYLYVKDKKNQKTA